LRSHEPRGHGERVPADSIEMLFDDQIRRRFGAWNPRRRRKTKSNENISLPERAASFWRALSRVDLTPPM